MIDIRAARAEPDAYRAALARKGAAGEFDALMEADRAWLALVPRADELRGKTKLKGKPTPEQLEELKAVKADLQRVEEELAAAEARRAELLERVPAPPDASAPDGFTEEDAAELRRFGEPPSFDFEPRDHLELARHVLIPDGPGRYLEGVHQGQASAKQRRQRPSHLRGRELPRDVAQYGNPENQTV